MGGRRRVGGNGGLGIGRARAGAIGEQHARVEAGAGRAGRDSTGFGAWDEGDAAHSAA